MILDVVSEIVIRRPRAEVAAYAADPLNAPAWYVNIKSVECETDGPLRVGSRFAFVAHFLGRRLAYTYEVSAFEPEARLVMTMAEGPFPMETSYAWESVGADATRMRLRNRGTPAGFSRLFTPIMPFAIRRANQADLARLKRVLENV